MGKGPDGTTTTEQVFQDKIDDAEAGETATANEYTLEDIVKLANLAPTTRYCPLTIHMGEPSCCVKESCAWFVRNGCAIFHLACAAIEWEKVLRSRGGLEK